MVFCCVFRLSISLFVPVAGPVFVCVRVAESPVVFVQGSPDLSVGRRLDFVGLRRWFFVICFCSDAVFVGKLLLGCGVLRSCPSVRVFVGCSYWIQ